MDYSNGLFEIYGTHKFAENLQAFGWCHFILNSNRLWLIVARVTARYKL